MPLPGFADISACALQWILGLVPGIGSHSTDRQVADPLEKPDEPGHDGPVMMLPRDVMGDCPVGRRSFSPYVRAPRAP